MNLPTKIVGVAPCKYAVAGMGSVARKKVTVVYSDFEHILLLKNVSDDELPKYMKFFRWASLLFHLIMNNLGETAIPCLNIPYLN